MDVTTGAELDDATIERYTRVEQRSELRAIRTAPHTRSLFWLGITVAAELAIIVWLLTSSWTAALGILLLGSGPGVLLAVWVTCRVDAVRRYRKAWRVATVADDHGLAVIRLHPRPHDTYLMEALSAWPMAQGYGTRLLTDLTRDADQHQHTLNLTASSKRVAGLYQRHGWQRTGRRTATGGIPMTRTPRPASRAHDDDTEHPQSMSATSQPPTPQTPHPQDHA